MERSEDTTLSGGKQSGTFSADDISNLRHGKKGTTSMIMSEGNIIYGLMIVDEKAAKKFFNKTSLNDIRAIYEKEKNSFSGDQNSSTEAAVKKILGEKSGIKFYKAEGTKENPLPTNFEEVK